jgi:hypothetical protein
VVGGGTPPVAAGSPAAAGLALSSASLGRLPAADGVLGASPGVLGTSPLEGFYGIGTPSGAAAGSGSSLALALGLQLSTCRGLLRAGMEPAEALAAFESQRLTAGAWGEQGPGLLQQEGGEALVVRLGDALYSWQQAAPLVLGLLAFGTKPEAALGALPADAVLPLKLPITKSSSLEKKVSRWLVLVSIACCVGQSTQKPVSRLPVQAWHCSFLGTQCHPCCAFPPVPPVVPAAATLSPVNACQPLALLVTLQLIMALCYPCRQRRWPAAGVCGHFPAGGRQQQQLGRPQGAARRPCRQQQPAHWAQGQPHVLPPPRLQQRVQAAPAA